MACILLAKVVVVGVLVECQILKKRTTGWLKRTWMQCRNCDSDSLHVEEIYGKDPMYVCDECGEIH